MKKQIAKRTGLPTLVVGLFALLFFAGSQSCFAAAKTIGAAAAPVQMGQVASELNKSFIAVSKAVLPTVVSIQVKFESKMSSNAQSDQWEQFFGFNPFGEGFAPQQQESEASGSGVIITSDGYIVTNNHVVEDAKEIKVTTYDKKTYTAKCIGTDPATDLAVIKIEETGLPVVHFATMNDVNVGEMVLALGNPLGLNSTITQGIISAVGRGQLALNSKNGKQIIENYIQTDAAINPGNSGGGLFDLSGSLVGINAAIATNTGTYVGYAFSIPVDLVKSVAEDLIDDGKIDRGYIGVTMNNVNEAMAKAVGLGKIYGVTVQGVTKKGPAEKAGIEIGDIITEVDGKEIESSNELQGMIFTKRVGDKVKLTIIRDKQKLYKDITLGTIDDNAFDTAVTGTDDSEVVKDIDTDAYEAKFSNLGFTVEKLTAEEKDDMNIDYGVMVSKVERSSEAYKNGLSVGTVIQKADRKKISSPYDLNQIMKSKKSGDAILLQTIYKNQSRMIAILIP